MRRRRSRVSDESLNPLGPIATAICILISVGILIYLHVAAYGLNSPLDTGVNSYWQRNLRGQSWVLLAVVDAVILITVYRWIGKLRQSRARQ